MLWVISRQLGYLRKQAALKTEFNSLKKQVWHTHQKNNFYDEPFQLHFSSFPYLHFKTAKKIKDIYNLHKWTYCVYLIQLLFYCHSLLQIHLMSLRADFYTEIRFISWVELQEDIVPKWVGYNTLEERRTYGFI